ncbi:MAG: glycosyltransferase family 9 protein [Nitrospira sp.]|nr:glycosyltransferase family 9 protein [Nitrospira sp.]
MSSKKRSIADQGRLILIDLLLQVSNLLLRIVRWVLWPRRPRTPPARICIYRIGNVGDTVCAIPAFWSIRQTWPAAKLTLLSSPGPLHLAGAREVVGNESWIDETIIYASQDLTHPGTLWRLIKELRAHQFDLWIELPTVKAPLVRYFRNMVFARVVGARYGIGWRKTLLTLWPALQSEAKVHPNEVQRLLSLLEAEGLPVKTSGWDIWNHKDDQETARRLLADARAAGRPLIAIAPAGKLKIKSWFTDRWAEVVRDLDRLGCHCVLLGGSGDRSQCDDIAQRAGCRVTNLAGRTTIPQVAALLRHCRLLVCVDSGIQHIAALAGARCVTLTVARNIRGTWYPEGDHLVLERRVPCHTCLLDTCPHDQLCMKEITVDDVKEAVRNMLGVLRSEGLRRTAGGRSSLMEEVIEIGEPPLP